MEHRLVNIHWLAVGQLRTLGREVHLRKRQILHGHSVCLCHCELTIVYLRFMFEFCCYYEADLNPQAIALELV
jgi:hypothetical protein